MTIAVRVIDRALVGEGCGEARGLCAHRGRIQTPLLLIAMP